MPAELRQGCNEDLEMQLLFVCLGLLWRTLPTWANVEKTIFLAPSFMPIQINYDLAALNLDVLSPSKKALRRRLPASFANSTNPQGSTTWFLLENLVSQQRYEVRVCWTATVSQRPLIKLLVVFPVGIFHNILLSTL